MIEVLNPEHEMPESVGDTVDWLATPAERWSTTRATDLWSSHLEFYTTFRYRLRAYVSLSDARFESLRAIAGKAFVPIELDTVTLSDLDDFVRGHPNHSRASVTQDALRQWLSRARTQERDLQLQRDAPISDREKDDRASWRKIQDASARNLIPRLK